MPDGKIGFAANGRAIDWLVVMRRFEQSSLFDALAQAGGLSASLMNELAGHIADFHALAEQRFDFDGAMALTDTIETNHCCLMASQGAGFALGCMDEIRERSLQRLAASASCLTEGALQERYGIAMGICISATSAFSTACRPCSIVSNSRTRSPPIDLLYDLAFLLMDLDHRGLTDFSNLVLNRYLDLTDGDAGLPAMSLFLSLRAAIRAHVTATAMGRAVHAERKPDMAAEARRYLDLAVRLLCPRPCRLVAIGGLSGSGKSTLAAALAPEIGARVLRSDVIRKRLFGVASETRLPASAYAPGVSQRIYRALRDKAATALAAEYSVIIDAVSLKPEERRSFAAFAEAAGVPFTGLWLAAPASTMGARLRARGRGASDASPAVLAQQVRQDAGPINWVILDAGTGPEACLAAARSAPALG